MPREAERTAAEHPLPVAAAPPPMLQPVQGGDPAAAARRSVTLRTARAFPAEPRARKRDPRPAMARLAQSGAGCPASSR